MIAAGDHDGEVDLVPKSWPVMLFKGIELAQNGQWDFEKQVVMALTMCRLSMYLLA